MMEVFPGSTLAYNLKCDYNLSRHLELFDGIREGLDRARLSARCLLTRDPFEAWEKVAKRREEEFEMAREIIITLVQRVLELANLLPHLRRNQVVGQSSI